MNNAHLLIITTLRATNTRPARVKIQSPRFNESVVVPFDYEHSYSLEQAIAWLQNAGYTIINTGDAQNGYFATVKEFVSPKAAQSDFYVCAMWRANQ